MMKIGILQTAPNNCSKLDELVGKYLDVRLIHYVDECVWEHVEASGGIVTEKCQASKGILRIRYPAVTVDENYAGNQGYGHTGI